MKDLKLILVVFLFVVLLFIVFCVTTDIYKPTLYKNGIRGEWVCCPQCGYQFRLSKEQ
jgi:hypothetical protein